MSHRLRSTTPRPDRAPAPRRRSTGTRAHALVALGIAAACALAAGPAAAGIERAGTTAADFLSLGSSAGRVGMGGAGLALEGGLDAAASNPASLARIARAQIAFSHGALGEQTAQEWAGFAGRLRFAGLAAAVTGLFQSEGSFEGRDALNNPTGSFGASSLALGFGVARAFGPRVTAGAGMKYASETLGGVRGSGVTFDAGLQVRSGALGFAAAAQNAFGQMKYDGAIYAFPSNYALGASYEHARSGVRVALDLNLPTAYYTDLRGGVEWRMNDRLVLRTGYRAELGASAGEPLGGPTFGMGLSAGAMWLDYGYLVGGSGPGQHRIAVRLEPGAWTGPGLGSEGRGKGYASAEPMPVPKVEPPASKRAEPRDPAPASPAPKASEPPSAPAPTKPAATAPATAPARASAPAPTNPVAIVPAVASAKASAPVASAPAKASAPATAPTSATPSAPAVAKPPAVAGGDAAGPVAVQLSTPPVTARPTYVQRAKAARGTANAGASGRSTAAVAPSAAPRGPIAPQAPSSSSAPRTDSTAAARPTGAAPAPAAPSSASPPSNATPAAGLAPTPNVTAPAAPAPQERKATRPRPEKVRVKNGQTMADVAREYGTSVPAIMMENNLVTDRVHSGQVLRLPKK